MKKKNLLTMFGTALNYLNLKHICLNLVIREM
jgi:hypothetical protein